MDFNIYLNVKPDEWHLKDNQIIISKRLPSKLNLVDYKVALIEFSSNYKNEYFMNILGFTLPIIFPKKHTINVPFRFNENQAYIEKRINTYIKAYYFYLLENCYYNYDNLFVSNDNTVWIIKNKNSDKSVIVLSKNLINKFPTIAIKDRTYFMVTKDVFKTLENLISKDPTIKKEVLNTHIDNKEFVLIDFDKYAEHQINWMSNEYDKHYTQLEYAKEIKIDIMIYKDYFGITLKQNDALKLSLLGTLLIKDKEIKTYIDNNNLILIESELVPFQYFNSNLKRLLKVINYEKDFKSNIYYNVVKPHLTTINITLSSLNDNISIEKIIKDYIFINLHFKQ